MIQLDEGAQLAELDRLFTTIGRYVVLFQFLEGKVDQSLFLLWGHENWSASQARIANMSNEKKVDALFDAFLFSPGNERGRTRPDWVSRFEGLIARLHGERQRRNTLLHSQYLLDFIAIGTPPIQSDRRKRNGEAVFDQIELTEEAQCALLESITKLILDLNFAHIQLIHDYYVPKNNDVSRRISNNPL